MVDTETDPKRPASASAREIGERIAEGLFTGKGEKGNRLVIEGAGGRELGSWSEGTVAHFFALAIDRAWGR